VIYAVIDYELERDLIQWCNMKLLQLLEQD